MRKVLFTASVTGHLEAFHIPYLQYFKDRGFEVHTASGGLDPIPCVDRHFDIPFARSPFAFKNLACYRTLKRIIDENAYDIIHCHTPVVSVLTRLAARKARKKGTVVVYTAHGFHFYKGASKFWGTAFRLMEKWLCRYTDHLITINEEDYNAVKEYGFKPGTCYKVPGVGVDTRRFILQTAENRRENRQKYGVDPKAFVLIFAAELSHRKNQQMLLTAMSILKKSVPDALLLLPGEGPLRGEYEQQIRSLGLERCVRLMGYRTDMDALLLTADAAVSSSLQEGLPINIVEAMSVSLPAVATRVRGHVDLIREGENGFLVDVNDARAMAERLQTLHDQPELRQRMSDKTLELVQPFLLENAREKTIAIYEAILADRAE